MEINGITRSERREELWEAAQKYFYESAPKRQQQQQVTDETGNAVSADTAAQDVAPSQVVQATTSAGKADHAVDQSQRQIAKLEQALQKPAIHLKTTQASQSVAEAEARIARRAQAQQAHMQASQGQNTEAALAGNPYSFTNEAPAQYAPQAEAEVPEAPVEDAPTDSAMQNAQAAVAAANPDSAKASRPQANAAHVAAQSRQGVMSASAQSHTIYSARVQNEQDEMVQRELDEQEQAQSRHIAPNESAHQAQAPHHNSQASNTQDSSTTQSTTMSQQINAGTFEQQGDMTNGSGGNSSSSGQQSGEQAYGESQASVNLRRDNASEDATTAQTKELDESKFAFVTRDEGYEVAVSNEGEILSIVDPNSGDEIANLDTDEANPSTQGPDFLSAQAGINAYSTMQYGEEVSLTEESAPLEEQEVQPQADNAYVAAQASQAYTFYQQGRSEQAVHNEQAMQAEAAASVSAVATASDEALAASSAGGEAQGLAGVQSQADSVSNAFFDQGAQNVGGAGFNDHNYLTKNDEAFLNQVADRTLRGSLSHAIANARMSGSLQGPLRAESLFSSPGILSASGAVLSQVAAGEHSVSKTTTHFDNILSRAAATTVSPQEVRDNLISLGTSMVDALATISKLPLDTEDPVTKQLKAKQQNEEAMKAFMLRDDPVAEAEQDAKEQAQAEAKERAQERLDQLNEGGQKTVSAQRYQQEQFAQTAREEQRIKSLPTTESLGIFEYGRAMNQMQSWADNTYRQLMSDPSFQNQLASGSSLDRDFMSVVSSSQNFEM